MLTVQPWHTNVATGCVAGVTGERFATLYQDPCIKSVARQQQLQQQETHMQQQQMMEQQLGGASLLHLPEELFLDEALSLRELLARLKSTCSRLGHLWRRSCSRLVLPELPEDPLQLSLLLQQLETHFAHLTSAKFSGTDRQVVRQVLAKLPGLLELHASSPAGGEVHEGYFQLLPYLPQGLRSLKLHGRVLDNGELQALASLTCLTCCQLECRSISPSLLACQQVAQQLSGLQKLGLSTLDDTWQPLDSILAIAACLTALTHLHLGVYYYSNDLTVLSSLTGLQELSLAANVPAAQQQQLFGPMQQLTALALPQQRDQVAAALRGLSQLCSLDLGRVLQPNEDSTAAVLSLEQLTSLKAGSLRCSQELQGEKDSSIRELSLWALHPYECYFGSCPGMPHLQQLTLHAHGTGLKRWPCIAKLLASCSGSLQRLELRRLNELLPGSMPQLQHLTLDSEGPRLLAALNYVQLPALRVVAWGLGGLWNDEPSVQQLEDMQWLARLPALRELSVQVSTRSPAVVAALRNLLPASARLS
jgi:hypothetical protein